MYHFTLAISGYWSSGNTKAQAFLYSCISRHISNMATAVNTSKAHSKKKKTEAVKVGDEEMTTEEIELFKKKIVEDNRMDSIFRLGQNLTEKFDNRAYLHPHGMTDFDYKSMPEYRRNDFEKFKHKTRHENYQYLGDHPEVDGLLALFFKKLLQAQPLDPIHFAAEYFTRDTAVINYTDVLSEERERLSRYRILKMKAAEKINTVPVYDIKEKNKKEVVAVTCAGAKVQPTCEKPRTSLTDDRHTFADYESPEALLNWLKKLNIGPLAKDVDTGPKAPPVIEIKAAPKKKKKKYCGCKDPGRRERAHRTKKSIVSGDRLSVAPVVENEPEATEVNSEAKPKSPDYVGSASDTDVEYEVDEEDEDEEEYEFED